MLSTLPLISIPNSKTQVKEYSVFVSGSHPQSMKIYLPEECFSQNDYSKTDPLPCNQSQFLPWNTISKRLLYKPNQEHREKSMMNEPQA